MLSQLSNYSEKNVIRAPHLMVRVPLAAFATDISLVKLILLLKGEETNK